MPQKESLYTQVFKEITAVLEGEENTIAQMATISCLLPLTFKDFFWTGFYLVDPLKENELVIGPYQGTLGCLRISFDRGVCGAAATLKQTQIVKDVHSFPGHIACDSRTNSEITVPVLDKSSTLIAILDIDSEQPSTFDEEDKFWLEKIMESVFTA